MSQNDKESQRSGKNKRPRSLARSNVSYKVNSQHHVLSIQEENLFKILFWNLLYFNIPLSLEKSFPESVNIIY